MAGSGVNLANAYVTLTPTMRGVQGALDNAFGAADASADRAGQSSGRGFVSRLGGVLKTGALAVGAAAAGTLSAAFVKGWGRLTNIENAQAKLAGLGHSADSVKAIMDNALASVKGTAFGLDAAATTAAGAVASGIKPGKDLERTLKLVGDAATIGGTSMGEMGAIFNKVAASGKLQGDVIAQLGDRGIPILQLLGQEIGKTPAEVAKLASQGKIDFATFQNAMEKGLGGAALKSGETTIGAFKNMGAALSRFGAILAGPIFPLAKVLFNGITTALDKLGGVIKPFSEALGTRLQAGFVKAQDAAQGFFFVLSDTFKGSGDWAQFAGEKSLTGFAVRLGTLTNAAEGLRHTLVDAFFGGESAALKTEGGLTGLAATIGDVANQVQGGLYTAFQQVSAVVGPALATVSTAFKSAFSGLGGSGGGGLLDSLAPMLEKVAPLITGYISRWADVFAALIPVIASVLSGLAPIISDLVTQIGPLLSSLIPIVSQVAGVFSQTLVAVIGALAPVLPPLVAAIGQVASVLAGAFLSVLTALGPVIPVLAQALGEIANILAGALAGALQAVLPILPVLAQLLGQVAGMVAGTLAGVLQALLPILPPIVTALTQIAQALLGALMGALQAILPVIPMLVNVLVMLVQAAIVPLLPILPLLANLLATIISAIAPIIPVVIKVVALLIQLAIAAIMPLLPVIVILANLFAMLITAIIPILQVIITVAGAFIGFAATVIGTVVSFVSTVVGVFTGLIGAIASIFGAIFSVIRGVWTSIFGFVSGIVSSIASTMSKVFSSVGNAISGVFSGIGRAVGSVFDTAVSAVKGAVNGVISLLNAGIGFINSKLIDTANKVPFVNIPHIPQIPRLAEGGIVPATPGGVLAFLGEGGQDELVLPRSKARAILGGGPAPVINVYPRQEIDIPALARQVARELAWGTA